MTTRRSDHGDQSDVKLSRIWLFSPFLPKNNTVWYFHFKKSCTLHGSYFLKSFHFTFQSTNGVGRTLIDKHDPTRLNVQPDSSGILARLRLRAGPEPFYRQIKVNTKMYLKDESNSSYLFWLFFSQTLLKLFLHRIINNIIISWGNSIYAIMLWWWQTRRPGCLASPWRWSPTNTFRPRPAVPILTIRYLSPTFNIHKRIWMKRIIDFMNSCLHTYLSPKQNKH